MIFLFVLEDGWFKEFIGGGAPELGELGIVLSHEVHDVAQRLDVERFVLQGEHDYRAQPLDNLGVTSLREREVPTAVFGIALAMLKRVWHCARLARKVPRHGEHLVAEHGELFGDTYSSAMRCSMSMALERKPK